MVSIKKNIGSFLVQKMSHPRWDELINLMETRTECSDYDYDYEYHGIDDGSVLISRNNFDSDDYPIYTIEEAFDLLEKEDQLNMLPPSYCIQTEDLTEDEMIDILSHISPDRLDEAHYFLSNWEVIGINRYGNFDWDDAEYPYEYTLTFEQYTNLKNSTGVASNYQIF
jgi:hypothetical protein